MPSLTPLTTPRRPAVLGLVLTAHLSGLLGLGWALHGRPASLPAARPMAVTLMLIPQAAHSTQKTAAPARAQLAPPRSLLAPSQPVPMAVLQAAAQATPLLSAPAPLGPEPGKARADKTILAALPPPPSPVTAPLAPLRHTEPGTPAQLPAEHGDCAARQAARLYPAALRERGIEGQVLLRVQVAEDGRAAEVRVQRGSGWRLLDQAAQALALACRYVPAQARTQEQLQALSSWVEVPVRFALQRAGGSTAESAAPSSQ